MPHEEEQKRQGGRGGREKVLSWLSAVAGPCTERLLQNHEGKRGQVADGLHVKGRWSGEEGVPFMNAASGRSAQQAWVFCAADSGINVCCECIAHSSRKGEG